MKLARKIVLKSRCLHCLEFKYTKYLRTRLHETFPKKQKPYTNGQTIYKAYDALRNFYLYGSGAVGAIILHQVKDASRRHDG